MKRRSKAGGKASKAGRRKAATPKRSSSAKAVPGRRSTATNQDAEVARLTRERDQAVQQQTATADVLRIISRATFDLQAVLDTLVASACRHCDAYDSIIFLRREERLYVSAHHGPLQLDFHDWPIGRGWITGRAVVDRTVVHVNDPVAFAKEYPDGSAMARRLGNRTILCVPMLRGDEAVGALTIRRSEAMPFTDKEIKLVETFAAQAVIAIENTRLLNELRESLDRQTATSEVLRIISASQGELQPVFNTILENAVRVCGASFGNLILYDGETFTRVAVHNAPATWAATDPRRTRDQAPLLYRLADSRAIIHVADIATEALGETIHKLAGARTLLLVPMLKDGELIGAVGIYRQEVEPFTGKQIELLQNFAAQAVIAIENARLLSELRESLDQQTATAGVLRVISSSPGELEPVFRSILDNATRICQANFGTLFLREGEALRVAAHHGSLTKAWDEQWRVGMLLQPDAELQAFQTLSARQPIQVADLSKAASYLARNPKAVNSVEIGGIRTMVTVPMLKDGEAIGVITIFRTEIRELTEKQIALLTNFAAQAVIAIENARLLNELRQRTADLTESLEQQTATAEILRVISSSSANVQPVFDTIVRRFKSLCGSVFGAIYTFDGELVHFAGGSGFSPAQLEGMKTKYPVRVDDPSVLSSRTILAKEAVHIDDVLSDPDYDRSHASLGSWRRMLSVPMLRDGEPLGAIVGAWAEPGAIPKNHEHLLKVFADHAVIAIENARLLGELRQSLEQQTATSEVLGVISSSPGELEPVFNAMLENATRICGAKFGLMFLSEGNSAYRTVAMYGAPAEFIEARQRSLTVDPSLGTAMGYTHATKAPSQIADVQSDSAYTKNPNRADFLKLTGARTVLNVPMLKEGVVVGQIAIYRQEVQPFTDKQVALLTSFAAQAVIAIEDARLLNELRQRTDDLSKSLDDLRAAQDRLVQTQKLASLGQLTAGIAHEIKNPLNFVNNFSGVSVELIEELQDALRDAPLTEKAREEINELSDTLRDNLGKIVQHGKRADSIVKNMLLHSREGSGERRSVEVNALVEESLNLAYHGARAETQGFNVKLERSFDPAAGEIDVFPQEITRVLLNLISNGFYAATKRQGQESGSGFEPTITAVTKSLGDHVEIRIRDNGIGIPPEVREKMFNPFFTTKPAGEGTGLGLSISHDIIVKQHGGSIEVDTKPGEFTEFRIVLPRKGASLGKSGDHA